MKNYESQGGVSFLLIYFLKYDEIVYLRFKDIEKFINRAKAGGKKALSYEELNLNYTLPVRSNFWFTIWKMLNKDDRERNE